MTDRNDYKNIFDGIHISEKTKQEILELNASESFPAEREKNTIKRWRRSFAAASAAFVMLFAIGIVTYAAVRWNGFSLTKDLSKKKIEQLMEQAAENVSAATDLEGNVHYYDSAGNEIMVLSPEDEKQYSEERKQRKLKELQSSTSLVDVASFWPYPSGITELPLSSDGVIPDYILRSGHMVIFYPEETSGFSLHSGDRLTVQLKSDEECYLAFYVIENGKNLEELEYVDHTRTHCFTFDVTKDGEYCIAVMYYSAGADNFTNGSLLIESAK